MSLPFLNEIGKELDFIFGNEKNFIDIFCKGEIYDLIGVYFSDETIKVYYILECGQHITDSFKIEEYIEWKNKITTKE